MTDTSPEPRSFAETALAGEDARRHAEPFARPARVKFRRHVALFVLSNLVLGLANVFFLPGHVVFFYLTIVWGFILADNFIWAYVVDPDRDVAERASLLADRERQRAERREGEPNEFDR